MCHVHGMALTWYGNQSSAEGCNFGALAMLWPLLERMQVANIINAHLPADPQAEFDHGRVRRPSVTCHAAGRAPRRRLWRGLQRLSCGTFPSRSSTTIAWDGRWRHSSGSGIRFWLPWPCTFRRSSGFLCRNCITTPRTWCSTAPTSRRNRGLHSRRTGKSAAMPASPRPTSPRGVR